MSRKKDFHRVSIVDVADAAGVSVATVSRVLNQYPNVSPVTKQRVFSAMQSIGYNSEKMKETMKASSSDIILVVIPSFGYELFSNFLKGIYHASATHGLSPMVVYTSKDPDLEKQCFQRAIADNYAGVILASPKSTKEEIRELSQHVPVIQCFDYIEGTGVPFICINDEKAGYDATKYLLDCGYRRIAMITAEERNSSAINRELGYQRAIKEAGLTFDPQHVFESPYTFDACTSAVAAFLDKASEFDAVFCVGDYIALKVLQLSKQRGIRVPEDLGVIGFDGLDIYHMFTPDLSTVLQDAYKVGFYALKSLRDQVNIHDRLAGGFSVSIEHNIVSRQSTRTPDTLHQDIIE